MKSGTTTIPTVVFSLVVLLTSFAKGSGSVAFEDVAKSLPAELKIHLLTGYEIAEVGEAIRLGRYFKELGGARIGPYTFKAKSKLANGALCEITLNTSTTFLDKNDQPTDNPELAAKIRESFDSLEVRFGNSEVDALTDAEKKLAVDRARGVYTEVTNGNFAAEVLEFNPENDPHSSRLVRHASKAGTIRKASFHVAQSDHSGFRVDVYCDQNGLPAFVLWEGSYWKFKGPGQTEDIVTERRFYFSVDGRLARALTKNYSGSGDAELKKNGDAASNANFETLPDGLAKFQQAFTQLLTAGEQNLEAISLALWKAQDQMLGH